ncbi:hypothetical protein VULLAG_LOCUS4454 [Vulpes lagopus]
MTVGVGDSESLPDYRRAFGVLRDSGSSPEDGGHLLQLPQGSWGGGHRENTRSRQHRPETPMVAPPQRVAPSSPLVAKRWEAASSARAPRKARTAGKESSS